jgi:hypothetical protein
LQVPATETSGIEGKIGRDRAAGEKSADRKAAALDEMSLVLQRKRVAGGAAGSPNRWKSL